MMLLYIRIATLTISGVGCKPFYQMRESEPTTPPSKGSPNEPPVGLDLQFFEPV